MSINNSVPHLVSLHSGNSTFNEIQSPDAKSQPE